MKNSLFPADFTWGAATAAYQIEGGWNADGKGPSIWDDFSHQPGRVGSTYMWDPASGDVACDHYHRWREDVKLLKELGVKAYRLSLSWPRLIPDGTGNINPQGVAFYRQLFEALREADIEPWVTLYHWDLPSKLMDRGGWLNRDSAQWFTDYALCAVREFGDVVRHWITFNEPQCFVLLGMSTGVHAPGLRLTMPELIQASHNVMLAHGRAVTAMRAASPQAFLIGYAPVGMTKTPETESEKDIAAARASMFEVGPDTLWNNSWWYDPVFLGRYPEDGLKHFGAHLPPSWENDLAEMSPPLDFVGTNIYMGEPVRAGADGRPEIITYPVGSPITAFKWTLTPSSLRWGPRFLHERYQLPVIITENGMSNTDWVHVDGTVPDPQRIDFLRRYLGELARGISDGADVRGYFHWSFLDNFEWAEGYKERFGLVHVDYTTLKRTPKQSFAFYREVIRSRGAAL